MCATDRPQRAPDVVLAGEMPDSSYASPQWLIQRGGRYLQVSEVLYRIAEASDGTHTPEEIAVLVGAQTRRPVTGEDVRALVEQRLIPAGVLAGASGVTTAPSNGPSSPLQITLRATVVSGRVLAPFAWLGSGLYLPGIVIVALVATVVSRVWLYTQHGVGDAFARVIAEPWHLFLIGAIAVASALFHELGHASALRAAGGRARGMGIGVYLIYPVFYTDVTDSYRLSRWRRVLTDLGGFYFNLIFSLGVLAAYVLTHDETLLVAVTLVDLEILHQMIPLGRLDGYWLLADITGVPDFFSIALPFARRVAGRPGGLPRLKPAATAVVAIYLALILPALALFAWVVTHSLPRFAHAALASFLTQAERLEPALASHDLGAASSAVAQGILLTLPVLAALFFLASIVRAFARLFVRVAGKTSRQRAAAIASAVSAIVLLVALWVPGLGDALAASRETAIPRAITGRHDPISTARPKLSFSTVPAPRSPSGPTRTAAPITPRTAAPPTAVPTASPSSSPPSTAPTSAPTTAPTPAPTTPSPSPTATPTGGTP
jgi:putative peptide zinc metalloprotease protein